MEKTNDCEPKLATESVCVCTILTHINTHTAVRKVIGNVVDVAVPARWSSRDTQMGLEGDESILRRAEICRFADY